MCERERCSMPRAPSGDVVVYISDGQIARGKTLLEGAWQRYCRRPVIALCPCGLRTELRFECFVCRDHCDMSD